jgi:hypothetical protein
VNNEAALSFSKLLIAGPYIEVTVIANAERIGRKLLYTLGERHDGPIEPAYFSSFEDYPVPEQS